MILAALALLLPPQAPVVPFAEARSVAYRDCVAAAVARRPDAKVEQIGRGACARPRGRLLSQVRDNVSYGWAAVTKTPGQRRRLREHLRAAAEKEVAGFEGRIEVWLAGGAGRNGR